MLVNTPVEGLRSRKKAETRRAIEHAAFRIATEHGYEATTATAIAAEANVSLRTLFNYFPQRDQAICGPTIELKDPALVGQQLAEAPSVLQGVLDAFDACTPELGGSTGAQRRLLIQSSPELLHLHHSAIDRFEQELTALVESELRARPKRRRLGADVSAAEEARLMVTAIGGVMRFGMQAWLSEPPGTAVPRRAAMARVTSQLAQILLGKD
jgi:AcrR family transcriptional regulator